jgi:hypothetical protein
MTWPGRHFQEQGDRLREARTIRGYADLRLALGEPDRATADLDRCIPIFRELLLRAEEARSLESLGLTLRMRGEEAAAQRAWRSAHAIFQELAMPEAVSVRPGSGRRCSAASCSKVMPATRCRTT